MFDKFVALAKQLYPTGRVFKVPFASFIEKFENSIAASEVRFDADARSILFAVLPDNAGFTTSDADDWERRLGMPNNSAALLVDRMAAIKRKLNAPGINPAHGHALSIQTQLQLANFNVYVYENIPEQSPFAVSGVVQTQQLQYGQAQYGQAQYGVNYTNKVVNSIDEAGDLYFGLGGSYRSSFFIGGNPKGSFANVPLVRKAEFRELILKLKQVQNVAFLFVNYV